jgi:hypothetical protein
MAVIMGAFDAAERYTQETMALVCRYRFPWGGALALPAIASAHAWRGAWSAAHHALALLVEPGQVFERPAAIYRTITQAYEQLMQIYASPGSTPPSAACAPAPALPLPAQCDITTLPLYCAMVELSAHRREAAMAAQLYKTLAPLAERGILFSRGWIFFLPHTLGLAACNGWWDRAETHLQAAITVATEVGARPFRGRAYLDYARMLHMRGQADDQTRALELVRKARLILYDLGMTPFVQQADDVLANTGRQI